MNDTEKKTLEIERAKIQNKLGAIEDNERRAEATKYLGKCFKYKNSYSCPEKKSDYWWLYLAVIGMDSGGNLKAIQFQVDKHGYVSFKLERWVHINSMKYSYIAISEAEYSRAKLRAIEAMDKLLRLRP